MKKRFITACGAIAVLLVPASPAFARSYQASAARAALKWSRTHYPSGTNYANVECYMIGIKRADCTIDFTTYSGSCRYAVTVSGPSYRVRKYDSSC
jgi:hypothetical protein